MRADRLISLVLLLRQRGRMSATSIARELEVSTRTVLRDVEALSTAGVPVYTERGRHGGVALLPGFRAELTGLHHDEALALLTAASQRGSEVLGLGGALASAMRKVLDALPAATTADDGARRILLDPDIDLLARREIAEQIPEAVLAPVRHAVLAGRQLALRYASPDRDPVDRTVDPIGLVTARGLGYLLAAVDGADRTYRLARIETAAVLPEPANRNETVDLAALWRERSTRFRAAAPLAVTLLLDPARLTDLQATALTVTPEGDDGDGRLRLDVTFQDTRHAEWALWQLGPAAETLAPAGLRAAIRDRAAAVADRHAP